MLFCARAAVRRASRRSAARVPAAEGLVASRLRSPRRPRGCSARCAARASRFTRTTARGLLRDARTTRCACSSIRATRFIRWSRYLAAHRGSPAARCARRLTASVAAAHRRAAEAHAGRVRGRRNRARRPLRVQRLRPRHESLHAAARRRQFRQRDVVRNLDRRLGAVHLLGARARRTSRTPRPRRTRACSARSGGSAPASSGATTAPAARTSAIPSTSRNTRRARDAGFLRRDRLLRRDPAERHRRGGRRPRAAITSSCCTSAAATAPPITPTRLRGPRTSCRSATCRTRAIATCEHINNAYDNTILYTDYFLSRVIDFLERQADGYEVAMLYVSDHGESLGENGLYLHGFPYSIAPPEQTRVPMLFWGSPRASTRATRSIRNACARAPAAT